MWGFEQPKAAFGMLLAFVAFEHRLGRERVVVTCIRGQNATALLHAKLLVG